MSTAAERLNDVRVRIERAAKLRPTAMTAREVTLLAVSKTQPIEAIEALYRLGQRDFAENYAQELAEKALLLSPRGLDEIRWHFIGHLQTNKVKLILPFVTSVHSVDSEKLARELSKRWIAENPLQVFIEVNIDGEETKSGVPIEQVAALAQICAGLPGLELRGLMCIPAAADSAPAFRRLRELRDPLGSLTRGELSMGMTQDFESAIREGATHVRIGTALFGPRAAG